MIPIPDDCTNASAGGGALASQVGGSHYKRWPIQPVQFSEVNELSSCQHSIIKYAMRYRDKDGVKDLAKAMHFCDLMVEVHVLHGLDWGRRCVGMRSLLGLPRISVNTFVEVNNLPEPVSRVVDLVCMQPSPARLHEARQLLAEMMLSVGGAA